MPVITNNNLPRPKISKTEYARVTSAINTVYKAKFEGRDNATIYHGNYKYSFKINDFNDYEFIIKERIK